MRNNFLESVLVKLAVLIIKAYRNSLGLLLPGGCRFYPSCSSYFIQALERYSLFKGFILGMTRIFKCHPFHPGGYDPLS